MSRTTSQTPPQLAVRIPADVEREDRLLAGLTARQLLILTVVAGCLYGVWLAARDRVPVEVFGAAAAPVAVAAVVVALGRRDGIGLDRWLAAAIAQRVTPRRRLDAPEGTAPLPAWIADGLSAATGTSASSLVGPRATAGGSALPATGVGEAGVVELDGDGIALLGAVSPVDFALRSVGEQEVLVGTFGRYLHAVGGPVQILIRTSRVDLSGRIADLRDQAERLPAALVDAADEHADFLTDLSSRPDLWTRQILLVLREPSASNGPDRQAAEARLIRRLDEATALLAPAGITIRALNTEQAGAVVASATSPASLLPTGASLAPPDAVVAATPALDAVAGRTGPAPGFDAAPRTRGWSA